jgi:hypothetical protein
VIRDAAAVASSVRLSGVRSATAIL